MHSFELANIAASSTLLIVLSLKLQYASNAKWSWRATRWPEHHG
jgi:hypothetical protein